MPRKRYEFTRVVELAEPLEIARGQTVMEALKRVLHFAFGRLQSFPHHKGGQMCYRTCGTEQIVGPLQISISDVCVLVQTHIGITGGAAAIGEQPIKVTFDHFLKVLYDFLTS